MIDMDVGLCSVLLCKILTATRMQGCSEQTALARRDLSCTYLAHHELQSVIIIIIIITIIIIIIIIIIVVIIVVIIIIIIIIIIVIIVIVINSQICSDLMSAICDASPVYFLKQHVSRFPANFFRDHSGLSLQLCMQASMHIDKQN